MTITDLAAPKQQSFSATILDVAAAKWASASGQTVRYLVRAAMAGVIIAILYLASFAISGNLSAALGSNVAFVGKLLGSAVFALVLFFIVNTGSELTTSTMMVTGVGVYYRRMTAWQATRLLLVCMAGNAAGGLLVAVLLRGSSILSGPTLDAVTHAVSTKLGYLDQGLGGYSDLFVRAILCNLLINLAMLVVYTGYVRSDFGKLVALWGAVFVFAVMGFEHSVANTALFTVFGLSQGIDIVAAVVAVLVAFLGNLVGGGVLIGLLYAFLDDTRAARVPSPSQPAA